MNNNIIIVSISKEPIFRLFAFLTLVMCILPTAFNFVGFDFTSKAISLNAEKVATEGVVVDSLFYALKGASHHALLEWSAVSIALLTVLLSFANFGVSRDITVPVIGMALFCSGVMDMFHTLAALRLIDASAANTDLIPFTWALSRTFNAGILFFGVLLCLRLDVTKAAAGLKRIIPISLIFGVTAYALIRMAATSTDLPQTQYPDAFITRPFDVLPLVLFMFAAPFFCRLYEKIPNFLTASLILSLIPAIVLEIHMAFGSTRLFDNHFNIAHFLKIIEYLVPFIGLSLEYVRSHRLLESAESELKSANENLEKSAAEADAYSARMHAILETAADAIMTINSRGSISSFNRAAEIIFGYKEKEVLGRNVNMLMPTPYHEEHDGYLDSYVTTGIAKVIGSSREVKAMRKNGEIFPIDLSVSEVQTDGERLFTGFVRDISERKAAEEKLVDYAQELECQSLELVDARKKAENASRAKSEFLANMSHEIRTPMNGIIGTVSLMKGTGLSKQQSGYADIIRNSSDALLQLINDILDFSKIEAGKMDMEYMPFDLQVLLEEVKSVMFVHVKEGVDLQVFWKPETPRYVLGDPGRIRQVLYNLTGNAIKFTEKGCVKINVESIEENEEMQKFMVSVEDTGIGIPKDKLDYIFDKFHQAEETTTRRFGGTGLGLTICSELVHMMGGGIQVESVLGEGSTFKFTMVLPLSSAEDIEGNYTSKDIELIENIKFDQVQVLLAEDNPTNMMIATEILEQYGCHVTPAGNGLEAVERISAQSFDLIFMDCRMPEMDGYEATGLIRKYEDKKGTPKTPIVALTANAMKGDRDKCIESGMDGYLSKPIKKEELAMALLEWLPEGKQKKA